MTIYHSDIPRGVNADTLRDTWACDIVLYSLMRVELTIRARAYGAYAWNSIAIRVEQHDYTHGGVYGPLPLYI
jgi:hypothetical protein